MHISLDSALGRQRRLNSVGESVFQIAPDAAAGYSLRSLTGGDPAVVRVRRESDNNERDFNASGVSSGELVNWVNEQITPPLDLRELTATGRDGPIIEAAAAYSLRNLSDSYTGSVVEVRRSSDDAVRSFTAAEVTDGTLEDWVNTDVLKYSSDFSLDLDGFIVAAGDTALAGQTFEGESDVIKHTPSDSLSSSHGIRRLSTIPSSSIVSLKALVYIPSSNTVANGVQFRSASGELVSGTSTTDEWVEVEATGTSGSGGSSNTLLIRATSGGDRNFTGNGTDAIYYKNVSVTVTSADGTVSKWYDQSTTSGVPNAKHAVQTDAASQPKIVSAGTLVTTNGNPTVDFDDTCFLETDAFLDGSAHSSFAAINNQGVTSTRKIFYGKSEFPNKGFTWNYRGDQSAGLYDLVSYDGIVNPLTFSNFTSPLHFVSSLLINSTKEVFINGTSAATSSESFVADDGTLIIGSIAYGTGFDAQEIIIYNSDQTDNRTALEANIGEVYGIAGIPAYEDTVNGFVETWYDQSGNGNDATQLTAGNQPKIVDAGSLIVGGLAFDGVSDRLSFASSVALSSNDFFVTSVLKVLEGDGVDITPVGNANGNRFLMSLNYDNNTASMRPDDGSFLVEGFSVGEPTGNILATVQRVSNTVTLFHQASNQATFNATGKSFTLGNLGQRFPSSYSKHLLNEIIIYPSDQSANRLAIEANINNQYDIY
jgi:hypothetical protein